MTRRCNVCIACLHPIFFLFGEFFFCFLSPILNFLEYNKKLEKMKTIYEWIADYSAGTLTEPEAKVFRDRLENDGEVKRLFTDVRQMETVLKMLEVETSAEAWERLQKALSGMRNRRRRIRRTIAAGCRYWGDNAGYYKSYFIIGRRGGDRFGRIVDRQHYCFRWNSDRTRYLVGIAIQATGGGYGSTLPYHTGAPWRRVSLPSSRWLAGVD